MYLHGKTLKAWPILENDRGIHIDNVDGDVIGVDVSGSGNVIGKGITISGTISINNQQLAKMPDEYAKALRDFSESINQQIKTHNIPQSLVVPVQESVDELIKETEGVKPNQEHGILKKTELRIKFVNVAKNVLEILPKTAETVAAFTPLNSI